MIFARELPVGLPNLVFGSAARNAEGFVIVVLGCCSHWPYFGLLLVVYVHEFGIYDLWIDYPGLDFLDGLFSPELTKQQQRLCETLNDAFHEQSQFADVALPIQNYRSVIERLIHAILDSAATLPFMSVLSSIDDTLLRHSAEVSILGLMLGLRLDGYLIEQRKKYMNARYAKDVVNLGLGCMLHDVGELQLPEKHRESRRATLPDFLDDPA